MSKKNDKTKNGHAKPKAKKTRRAARGPSPRGMRIAKLVTRIERAQKTVRALQKKLEKTVASA